MNGETLKLGERARKVEDGLDKAPYCQALKCTAEGRKGLQAAQRHCVHINFGELAERMPEIWKGLEAGAL